MLEEGAYTCEQWEVLSGLECVRRRPGMYIGDTSVRGLHHLFSEVLDNAVNEVLAGYCTNIDVILGKDYTVSVEDNGRGIPQAIVELVFTELHASSWFRGDGKGYKVSGGLHGVGVACVNGLSDRLECRIKRDGNLYRIRFEQGVVIEPLTILRECNPAETGTSLRWLADKALLKQALTENGALAYEPERFRDRLSELAFLHKDCRFTFHDQLNETPRESFHYPGGIQDYLTDLNQGESVVHDIIHFETQREGTEIEVALQYVAEPQEEIRSFANSVRLFEGGTYLTGFKTALTRVFHQHVNHLSGERLREGLRAVIRLNVKQPLYQSPIKDRLMNPELTGLMNSFVGDELARYFTANPQVVQAILKRVGG